MKHELIIQNGKVACLTKSKPYLRLPLVRSEDIFQTLVKSKTLLLPSKPQECETPKLAEEIQTFIHKYLGISAFEEKLCTFYILFTWLQDAFEEVPYLHFKASLAGSGKSRALKTLGSIAYQPIFASSALSTASIFRILEKINGTLILDEADFNTKFNDKTTDLIKILNSGFQKGFPVLKCVPNADGDFDVKAFNCFGAKILASREPLPDDALESRCLKIQMSQDNLRNEIPINLPQKFHQESLELRNKLLYFRLHYLGKTKIKPELRIPEIQPRLNQILIPLASTIQSETFLKELKESMIKYNQMLLLDKAQLDESKVLEAILNISPSALLFKKIKKYINEIFQPDYPFSSKKIGFLIKNKLALETQRTKDGFLISSPIKDIKKLAKKYGVNKNNSNQNEEKTDDPDDINVEEIF